jgi:hypothetical protein
MSDRSIDRHAVAKVTARTKIDKKLHDNGYRTKCTGSILNFFGIEKNYRYCQFTSDMARIFRRNGWRMIPQRRNFKDQHFSKLNQFLGRGFYCVEVSGHVFLAYIGEDNSLMFPVDIAPKHKFRYSKMLRVYKIEINPDWKE